jgi:hypothetical protein
MLLKSNCTTKLIGASLRKQELGAMTDIILGRTRTMIKKLSLASSLDM